MNVHYGDVLIKYGSILDVESDEIPYIAAGKESKKQCYLSDGDVIIADTAEDETVGKCTEITNTKNAKIEAGLHTIPCHPRTAYAPMFLGYYMNSPYYHKQLIPLMQGVKVLSVSKSNIGNTLISAPISYSEQEKIVDMLHLLDCRMRRQQEAIDNLKKYKRGLLSNAFRNASSWRKKRLGEICCIRTGKLDANAMVNDGKYPFFTCARERYSIDTYAFDTDALLISGNGANVGYIHHYTGKFNAYQRTYVLDQFQEDINYVHVFLNRFLSSRIDAEKKAGNTPYIVLSTLSDMEIYIPDETTTKQLVDLFTQIENRISYSATVLEYLSSQRRGLLQQLFI